jgi:hypothetical protein
MKPWFLVVFIAGLGFFIGVVIYIIDVLTLATRKA